jgi:hypothetical protein
MNRRAEFCGVARVLVINREAMASRTPVGRDGNIQSGYDVIRTAKHASALLNPVEALRAE